MFKASINLGRINPMMSVKFNMILKDDGNKNPSQMLVNKFMMSGNEYITFNPHPWLSIDITKKPNEAYDPNNSISLTRAYAYKAAKTVKHALNLLKTEGLFVYNQEGRLLLNKDVSKDCLCKLMVKQKYIGITPMVIVDGDTDYEGLAFMINTPANYAALTIDEAEQLIHILATTDLNLLAMQTIATVPMFREINSEKIVKSEPSQAIKR